MRKPFFPVVLILIAILSFDLYAQLTPIPPADTLTVKDKKSEDTLSIIGVGDIMMGTNFPSEKYLPPDSGRYLFNEEIKGILKSADLTFGNHEGVLLDTGGIPKKCNNPDLCYAFRSPERFVNNLVDAGFDVVSLANNHMGDFGEPGRLNTIKVLDQAGIYNAGLLIKPYTIFTLDSITYGMAAFAPNTGTMDLLNIPGAKNIVTHLDSLCDIVIVSFHGGAEGRKNQNVTRKTEEFYGENRGNIYRFSHELIDAGADIVFGHGPHITRAFELYKNRFIAYSLGNFCTYARFNLQNENGYAPLVKIFTDRQGNFIKGQVYPIHQLGEGGPLIDPDKKVIKKLQELIAVDFPDTKIKVSDTGEIYKIKNQAK